jgi:hypothetical protein
MLRTARHTSIAEAPADIVFAILQFAADPVNVAGFALPAAVGASLCAVDAGVAGAALG